MSDDRISATRRIAAPASVIFGITISAAISERVTFPIVPKMALISTLEKLDRLATDAAS